jgi:hypothetical protein
MADHVPPGSDPILQFFDQHRHLRPDLAEVGEIFGQAAVLLATSLPRNPERTTALRKLLEAKDAAVRAVLYQEG